MVDVNSIEERLARLEQIVLAHEAGKEQANGATKTIPHPDEIVRRIESCDAELRSLRRQLRVSKDLFAAEEQRARRPARDVLATPISELNFSVRVRKAMLRLKIRTVGDLVGQTEDVLLEERNFGLSSLDEVQRKLRQLGLTLRPVTPR
jgi:DNA-directed RNA polymerase alpha subunit